MREANATQANLRILCKVSVLHFRAQDQWLISSQRCKKGRKIMDLFGTKKDKKKIEEAEEAQKWAMIGRSLFNVVTISPAGRKWAELGGEQSGNIASAAAEKEAGAREHMEKKAGLVGNIGRILGAGLGTAIPGIGPVV